MKNKRNDYNWTNNRSYYNKLRKFYLAVDGKISCSFDKYHKGENNTNNWYGGFHDDNGYYKEKKLKYPNWKLVSKNKKQWMNKKLKITKEVKLNWSGKQTYVMYDINW